MHKSVITGLLLACVGAHMTWAFSPYERHMLSAKTKRAALIAAIAPGHEAAVDNAFRDLSGKKAAKALKQAHIANLRSYKKALSGTTWVMVYFDYTGDNYLMAAADFEAAVDTITTLDPHLNPHPRATRYGTVWLQMEWICYIRGARDEGEAKNSYAMVTTLKPEKESEYRMLHQAVWPGVCDQMARGNNRHFSIFLVEIDETLYEFFHVEYVGTTPRQDAERDRTDPVNIRWWKQTDPCQSPLPGSDDIWSMMEKIEIQN